MLDHLVILAKIFKLRLNIPNLTYEGKGEKSSLTPNTGGGADHVSAPMAPMNMKCYILVVLEYNKVKFYCLKTA